MVSIAAFQAVNPGSIPGQRNWYLFTLKKFLKKARNKACDILLKPERNWELKIRTAAKPPFLP